MDALEKLDLDGNEELIKAELENKLYQENLALEILKQEERIRIEKERQAGRVKMLNTEPKFKVNGYIVYYRVSTERQGNSGLGLGAQKNLVSRYLTETHGNLDSGMLNYVIKSEYVEIESGRDGTRPKLNEALRECRRTGFTLLVAALDRLARSYHLILGLKESGLDFVCADNPKANRLTIDILAAVAEDEARKISERTKAALDEKRRREPDWKPGNPYKDGEVYVGKDGVRKVFKSGMGAAGAKKSWRVIHDKRLKSSWFKPARKFALLLADRGIGMVGIARELNEAGFPREKDKPWDYHFVKCLFRCMCEIDGEEECV